MAKKDYDNEKHNKETLGKTISKLRIEKNVSLRYMAKSISIPPSNLTYIEGGKNVPTADLYLKIIDFLQPSEMIRKKMDDLFIKIRHTPPPDVCNILIDNSELGEKLRLLHNVSLTKDQLTSIGELFVSFKNI